MSVMNLKLKVIPKFPSTVSVGTGLTLTNNGGAYTITLDADLAQFAALSLGPDQSIYWPSLGVPAAYSLTSAGRAIAATATALTAKTVLACDGSVTTLSTSPTISALTVNGNAANLPAAPTGTLVQVGGADAANAFATYDAFGTAGFAAGAQFRKARGTAAAPSAIQLDDPIGGVYAFGYMATGYCTTQRGFSGFFAGETWDNTHNGTYWAVWVTPTAGTASAEALRIAPDKSAIFSGPALKPTTSGGATLGTSALPFSNHFLANATKLDWSTGNVTLTHSTGKLTLAGTFAITGGSLDLSGASAGQIIFPATQNASANANTLDDYEEGTWTPTLAFATVGDSVWAAPSTQAGTYTKIGRLVVLGLTYAGTQTHTTSSGTMSTSALPFQAATIAGAAGNQNYCGALSWQGITKASYTDIVGRVVAGATSMDFSASGSGQALSLVASADVPTGGTVALTAIVSYFF